MVSESEHTHPTLRFVRLLLLNQKDSLYTYVE
jgi:hypothetical protein